MKDSLSVSDHQNKKNVKRSGYHQTGWDIPREPGSHEIFRLKWNVGRNSCVFVTNLTGKCFLHNEAKSSCQKQNFGSQISLPDISPKRNTFDLSLVILSFSSTDHIVLCPLWHICTHECALESFLAEFSLLYI